MPEAKQTKPDREFLTEKYRKCEMQAADGKDQEDKSQLPSCIVAEVDAEIDAKERDRRMPQGIKEFYKELLRALDKERYNQEGEGGFEGQ